MNFFPIGNININVSKIIKFYLEIKCQEVVFVYDVDKVRSVIHIENTYLMKDVLDFFYKYEGRMNCSQFEKIAKEKFPNHPIWNK